MWLLTIGLTLSALGAFAFAAGRWHPRREDHGSVSRQWLAEHRTGDHSA